MADTFRCSTCGQETPRYFMVEGGGAKPRVCLGCALDGWIPGDYQEGERYRPACPSCGGELAVRKAAADKPGRRGEPQYECGRCGLIWEEIEIIHANATRRPPLGVAWLDERHQTLEDALLMCKRKPRL